MKKISLVMALLLAAAAAYLVYDENAGLGPVVRPLQGVPRTPQQKEDAPFRQRGIFAGEPVRPPRAMRTPPPPPEPPVRSPILGADENELDDNGQWEYQQMEEVTRQVGKAPAPRSDRPGPGAPGRPRLGPEQKFDRKENQ